MRNLAGIPYRIKDSFYLGAILIAQGMNVNYGCVNHTILARGRQNERNKLASLIALEE